MAEATTVPTYDELRQRVLDGDTTITPAVLEKARRDSEFAGLQDEAGRRAEQRRLEAEHQAEVDQLRRDVERLGADAALGALRTAYRQLVNSAEQLSTGITAWQAQRTALAARAKALGLDPRVELGHLPELQAPERYAALAVDEAQGKLRWNPTVPHWKPGHELHTEAEIRAALAAAEAGRAEWARRSEAEHASRLAAVEAERLERKAAADAAALARRQAGAIRPTGAPE